MCLHSYQEPKSFLWKCHTGISDNSHFAYAVHKKRRQNFVLIVLLAISKLLLDDGLFDFWWWIFVLRTKMEKPWVYTLLFCLLFSPKIQLWYLSLDISYTHFNLPWSLSCTAALISQKNNSFIIDLEHWAQHLTSYKSDSKLFCD